MGKYLPYICGIGYGLVAVMKDTELTEEQSMEYLRGTHKIMILKW